MTITRHWIAYPASDDEAVSIATTEAEAEEYRTRGNIVAGPYVPELDEGAAEAWRVARERLCVRGTPIWSTAAAVKIMDDALGIDPTGGGGRR